MNISRLNLKVWIPYSKNKRRALESWNQISNQFSKILKIDLTGKKAVKFGIWKKITLFRLPIKQYFWKWFDVWDQCSNTHLLICHTTIFEQLFLKFKTGDAQALKSFEINDKCSTWCKSHIIPHRRKMQNYLVCSR